MTNSPLTPFEVKLAQALVETTERNESIVRKLYYACHHAYLWHCGNGNEQSEKDCMKVLQDAIEAYNSKKEE